MLKKDKKIEKPIKPTKSIVVGQKRLLPILALPNQVLFPGTIIPLSALKGFKDDDLKLAKSGKLEFGLFTDLTFDKSKKKTISKFGTEARVTALIKLPNGEFGAMIKGFKRLMIHQVSKKKHGYEGFVSSAEDQLISKKDLDSPKVHAFKNLVYEYLKYNQNVSQEVVSEILATENISKLGFILSPFLNLPIKRKLNILSNFDFQKRLEDFVSILGQEIEMLKVSNKIQTQVKEGVRDSMRKSFLREQMQLIKKELTKLGDDDLNETSSLKKRLSKYKLSKQAKDTVDKEFEKLESMHQSSPEYYTSWTYLNWIADLPWDVQSAEKKKRDPIDLIKAGKILDTQHFGIDHVKDKILEYLAVIQHKGRLTGQILALMGPPGVGKTSLGSSIAEALNRPFQRISLGGTRDESEIRGHRRTYIGSMPGKIIQALKNAKSSAPVILLDEIDKAGKEGMYDVSSALLEVLDPEQNKTFVDHYMSFPFDLSDVLFIATANSLREMSLPLLDRMEVVELSGYTEQEKIHIAKNYLLPKICKSLDMTDHRIHIPDTVTKLIVRHYTRESGVRQLNRCLQTIVRKIVRKIVQKELSDHSIEIRSEDLVSYLKMPKYEIEPKDAYLPPGVALGLAYTSVGGDVLFIESRKIDSINEGSKLMLTGSLGQVMQESAQTVYSFLLSNTSLMGIEKESILKNKIHVHLPDGATPKDGPSAGIALLCALTSLLSGKALRSSLAMTGEVTLRGLVLPVGGIKEKISAAHRYGKTEIILPATNWLDLEEVPDEVLNDLNIYPVRSMFEVLTIANLIESSDQKKVFPKKYHKGEMQQNVNWEEIGTTLPSFGVMSQ